MNARGASLAPGSELKLFISHNKHKHARVSIKKTGGEQPVAIRRPHLYILKTCHESRLSPFLTVSHTRTSERIREFNNSHIILLEAVTGVNERGTETYREEPNFAGKNRIIPGRAEPSRAESYRKEQNPAGKKWIFGRSFEEPRSWTGLNLDGRTTQPITCGRPTSSCSHTDRQARPTHAAGET